MRAAILGPLAFLAVPSLIWPAEMADLVSTLVQYFLAGMLIGVLCDLVSRKAKG